MKLDIITYTNKGVFLHVAEDSFNVSKKYPIFAVADGVTLWERNIDGLYPNPSGAKQVADAFCEKSIERVERNYQDFNIESVKEVFVYANRAIKEINDKAGRIKETINFYDFDYFHTTAVLAAIKDNKLFYGRVHDCWILVIDKNGGIKSNLIDPSDMERSKLAKSKHPQNFNSLNEKEITIYVHKYDRNRILENGEPCGYGVLTGEETALRYLDTGLIDLEQGDTILIYTDGFEEYVKLKEFLEIFYNWENKRLVDENLKKFSDKEPIREDDFKFGKERTLIAVRY